MFEITVEDSFAAGHALRHYRGKCENVHGHNYKVQVTLAGAELDNGLLFDFKDVKAVLSELIDRLDHQYLNDLEPFRELNPSAENMAKYLYDEASARLRQAGNGRVRVKQVKIWETDTTTATYFED
jgi:6-pyruvoyltetrahydropterin/6-carboxytetrahydropterin synthase